MLVCTCVISLNQSCFVRALDLHAILPKATPSDTLVSGPEVFLIACGRAGFLIMSLSISPYESHYFANEYHYHTILYHT